MHSFIQLDSFQTILVASFVLVVGMYLTKYIPFLRKNYIPEAVSGGFVVAILLFILTRTTDMSFGFDHSLQSILMIVFFTSVGLGADFSRIKEGGKPLIIFSIIISLCLVVQNFVGIGLALILHENPYYGILAGSITLSGGHGNGAAWGGELANKYGVAGAVEIAMACATFGLVLGGLVGGPTARYLIKKINYKQDVQENDINNKLEKSSAIRNINTKTILQTVGMLAISIVVGNFFDTSTKNTIYQMPTFVWCLFSGVFLRNIMTYILKIEPHDQTIDVLGNASLTLFLAMALMSLKINDLMNLGFPIFIIMVVQTLIMVLFAIFVTFRAMGKNYDAIVLSAGHCGFGLGATPTAIANMQAITNSFGPSPKAFLIVPIVGGFIINISNGIVIKLSIAFVANYLI